MNETVTNGLLIGAAAMLGLLLLLYGLHTWLMSWGHRYRAQVASRHQWQYHPHPNRPFTHKLIFHLTNPPGESTPWELMAYQSGLNKVRLSWQSQCRHYPEGLIVLYPRPRRLMKAVPRTLIPTMLNRVFGPPALPLSEQVVEMPLGDEMLDELFFVFTAHRPLVSRLLTPAIRNLLVHWPAPKGYGQRPIVSLFRRGLQLETIEPISVNDWLAAERLVALGLTISHYINPFVPLANDDEDDENGH